MVITAGSVVSTVQFIKTSSVYACTTKADNYQQPIHYKNPTTQEKCVAKMLTFGIFSGLDINNKTNVCIQSKIEVMGKKV